MRIKKDDKKPIEPQLGIIGKIKIGQRHPQKGYPMALDYFRFTDPFGGRYAKQAIELYGNKPKQLKVTFASNDFNQNCSQRYELRNSGGQLVAYSDLAQLFVSKKAGFVAISADRIEKGGGIKACMTSMEQKYTTAKYEAKFFECLYLRVVLMGFSVIGQWEIYTKASKSSIQQIIDTYDIVLKNAGRVAWMPFTLTVQKVQSNRLIPGEDRKRRYSVISLYPDVSVEMQEQILTLGDQIKGLVTADKIKATQAVKSITAPVEKAAEKEVEYVTYETVTD